MVVETEAGGKKAKWWLSRRGISSPQLRVARRSQHGGAWANWYTTRTEDGQGIEGEGAWGYSGISLFIAVSIIHILVVTDTLATTQTGQKQKSLSQNRRIKNGQHQHVLPFPLMCRAVQVRRRIECISASLTLPGSSRDADAPTMATSKLPANPQIQAHQTSPALVWVSLVLYGPVAMPTDENAGLLLYSRP